MHNALVRLLSEPGRPEFLYRASTRKISVRCICGNDGTGRGLYSRVRIASHDASKTHIECVFVRLFKDK
jgi:hypothetical protein